MNPIPYKKILTAIAFLFTLALLMPEDCMAQRMRHSASRGASASRAKSPSRSAGASNRGGTNRSASNRKSSNTRQSSNRQSSNRQATNRSSNSNRKSINGGHQKSTNRKVEAPANTQRKTTSRETNRSTNRSTDRSTNRSTDRASNRDVKRDGSRDGNRGSGNRGSGNKTNIDRSRGDVNINIDNSRNTRVVSSRRTYVRPPYRYGGFGYYCHRPYFYHPYRPFYWGPVWHPWGWFVATLATTAILVSIDGQSNDDNQVYYDQGVYYTKTDGGYEVIQAPVGATVETLPKETETVKVDETTNNYYYGGAYYEKSEMGYTVVPATAGTIVPHLPEGGEEVKIGEVTYVQFGETYYQPIQVDGQDMYEIVEVREE